jgi:hypothetical protein
MEYVVALSLLVTEDFALKNGFKSYHFTFSTPEIGW